MSDSSSSEEEEKEEERSVCGVVDLVVVGVEAISDGDVEGEVVVVVWSSEEEDMLSLEVCWGGGNESIVWLI